jgi:hypothetical protein
MFLNNIPSKRNMLGYRYHSVNGISYGLAQSKPIKRHPLYYKLLEQKNPLKLPQTSCCSRK